MERGFRNTLSVVEYDSSRLSATVSEILLRVEARGSRYMLFTLLIKKCSNKSDGPAERLLGYRTMHKPGDCKYDVHSN